MDEDKIVINKEGRTFTAFEKMKKIWAGTTLGKFSRRWLGESRSASLDRHNNQK